jgi:hypothetical protein
MILIDTLVSCQACTYLYSSDDYKAKEKSRRTNNRHLIFDIVLGL